MPRIINYQNKKFGALTLVVRLRSGGSGVGSIWMASCDCGNSVEVRAREVANGRRKTCGKCQLGRNLARAGRMRRDRFSKLETQAYSRLFRTAARRNKKVGFTPPEHVNIIHRNCSYCNTPAHQSSTGLNHAALIVDKLDYTLDNVDTICSKCRDYKQDHNRQDFLDMCMAVTMELLPHQDPT